MSPHNSAGPLAGLRVVEFAGMGPGPFGAMLLRDMGADLVCIARPGSVSAQESVASRGKRCVELDLNPAAGRAAARSLIDAADVVIEGYRPGVMEKFGLGPEPSLSRNPRLVYARMTGWGASGPLSGTAGHDINYLALAGVLAAIGPGGGPPCPPLNLVGDYGGGALYLVFGITCALLERTRSGRGQVVDAAIVDGVASLMANRASKVAGGGGDEPGQDHLDGSAHYYRAYLCSDGKAVAVGAIEPKFYRRLWTALGHLDGEVPGQDRSDWRDGGATLTAIFRQRPQSYWTALFADTDACCTPVLPLRESFQHPQVLARETYVERFGVRQPNVAPRLSRTPGQIQGPPCHEPTPLAQVLDDWGCEPIVTGDQHGHI